jgi:hypothetical protein
MKIINAILKVILSAILIMPILGSLRIFPEPTADMYTSIEAYTFIKVLMDSQYITIMMSAVFLISLICLWTKRVALASLLLLPISLNIVGFHAFIDGGLFTSGAIMGNVLFLINIYLLWQSRDQIKPLLKPTV